MRLLQLAPCTFPAGRGSAILIERLAQGLIARGHRVDTLAPALRERGRPETVPTLRAGRLGGSAPLAEPFDALHSAPQLSRLWYDAALAISSLRHTPDLLIGHNLEGGWIAALAGRARGIPSIYVRHSAFGEELALYGPWPAASRRVGEQLEQALRKVVHRTVSLAPLPGAECIPPPGDPREPAIAPAAGRILYYEGNLDPYQNPGWLAHAYRAARSQDPRVRLVQARRVEERPRAADLALVPRSLPGGFPMKLLAYQLAGIPAVCVASGAEGMVDGLDAFVVPGRGSPEAFAARVVQVLANPAERRSLAARARERARARNDPDRVAGRWEGILEHTLAEARYTRPRVASL